MTTGTIATQGTELFVIDTITSSDPTLIKMDCPTGITGLGGPRDQLEDTCLDTTGDKTFKAGLGNPGQVTVPFNLVPRAASHQALYRFKDAGKLMRWMAALSESGTDPTIGSDGDFNPPGDRSYFAFDAYVSDVNIDIATNEIVRGTMILQRSGNVEFVGFDPS